MNQSKFITGIFSVYDSSKARGFRDREHYPIGFEAIFHNDEVGQEFVTKLLDAMHRLPPERGLLYHLEGEPTDTARHADCFFRDADALRKVLNEALHGRGIPRGKGSVAQILTHRGGKGTHHRADVASLTGHTTISSFTEMSSNFHTTIRRFCYDKTCPGKPKEPLLSLTSRFKIEMSRLVRVIMNVTWLPKLPLYNR